MITDPTTLYRPVGQKEFDLVRLSGFHEFPPRLPEQPFFYPVLNEDYATQIARDWNAKNSSAKKGIRNPLHRQNKISVSIYGAPGRSVDAP